MRKLFRDKSWIWMAAFLVFSVGAIAWALSGVTAAASSLWTETKPVLPAAATPWVAVAKADTPAVVNISATQVVKNSLALGEDNEGAGEPFQQFFRHFFSDLPRTFRAHSLGSGFIVSEDGYVVTNNHVVDNATEIRVKLSDGREFPAKIVGRDSKTDLALLKINATGLPVLPFGDSDHLQVGEPVMAIGNPFGLEGTVTTGIVSAMGRVIGDGPYDNFIQTDASINPGNSGGPLVNAAGQVVGIDTAIFSQSGGSVGIGFAIPIDLAKEILPQLEAKGRVTRGWLGVSIQSMTPDLAKAFHLQKEQGGLVAQVLPDSPAAKAGLRAGDVIVAYDGHSIARSSDLPRLVAATPIGQTSTIQVLREGKPLTLTVQIAELPEPRLLATAGLPREALGLTVQPLTAVLAQELGLKDKTGVVVARVREGSPSAEAGLQPGDVIVEANGQPVKTVEDLRRALAAQKPGEPTLLRLHRQDSSLFVAVTTG